MAMKYVLSSYVTDTLTSLLLRGAPIQPHTATVYFCSIAILLVGVILFKWYGKS